MNAPELAAETADRDWSHFAGMKLAEVFDELYTDRLERAVAEWDQALIREGLAIWRVAGFFRLPIIEQIGEMIAARPAWRWFSPSAASVYFPPDKAMWDLSRFPREVRVLVDLLMDSLPGLFGAAALPLVTALYEGAIGADGIEEPEHASAYQHAPLPHGLFRFGRWVLYRNGSRLVSLDRYGHEIAPAFAVVRIVALDSAKIVVASVPLSAKAEGDCLEWLTSFMALGAPSKPKAAYFEEAKERFNTGTRQFERAWRRAVERSGNFAWGKPGRKSYTRIDTPIKS